MTERAYRHSAAFKVAMAFLALFFLLLIAERVDASHYRGGTVTWEPTGEPREAEFTGLFYYRLNYPWPNPPVEVGDVLPAGEFNYGDLDPNNPNQIFSDPLYMEVTAVNQAGNWFSAKWVDGTTSERKDGLRHTYFADSGPFGPWRASWYSAARLGWRDGHVNNGGATPSAANGDDMALWTYVDFSVENSAPKAILPPINKCVRNTVCTIDIIAGDYEQEDLFLSWASTEEATSEPPIASLPDDSGTGPQTFEWPGPPQAPNSAILDSDAMTFKWDTGGAQDGPPGDPTYYSMQIMVEDGVNQAQTPIDVFVELVDKIENPPYWVNTPCGETRSILHDNQLQFDVTLDSPIQGRQVTMMDVNRPTGSMVNPLTPVTGDPATTTFTWTPLEAQVGVYTVLFIGWDEIGTPAPNCVITIRVVDEPPAVEVTADPVEAYTFDTIALTGTWVHERMIAKTDWNFDDGATQVDNHITPPGGISPQATSHAYIDDGEYDVVFRVTDDRQLEGSDTVTVTILNRAPTAKFQASEPDQSADRETQISFSDQSHDCNGPKGECDGMVEEWHWDFGDGSTSSDQNPTHTYSSLGTFTVTLTVTDDDGATHSTTWQVTIENIGPTAAGFAQPNTVYTFETVNFVDVSTDDDAVVTWSWTFGDGASSTAQHPSHHYSSPGTYTVWLTVTDAQGASDSVSMQVEVLNRGPSADFTKPLPIYADVAATFEQSSHDCNGPQGECDGHIVSWTWQFGDGTTVVKLDGSSIQHTYAWTGNQDDYPGLYLVSLTVCDSEGACDMMTKMVEVIATPPTAAFSMSSQDADADTMIDFTDLSTDIEGHIVAWSWEFGDGSGSSDQHPSHAFTTTSGQDATFTITLTVTDNHGYSDSTQQTMTIRVSPPIADFTWSPEPALLDETIQFTDTSMDDVGVVRWLWNFGDGSSSAAQHPTHAYTGDISDVGTYEVTLTVTDQHGASHAVTKWVWVTVAPPTAYFTHPASQFVDQDVQFLDASTDSDGFVQTWSWDFGDGASSGLQNPSHSYVDDGFYTVTLTVHDNHGASDSYSSVIEIYYSAPVAVFDVAATVAVDTPVLFDESSFDIDGTLVDWAWDFGDGTALQMGAAFDPSHTFTTTAGQDFQVTITLVVTDNHGLTDAVSHTIDVLVQPPTASFTVDDDTPFADTAVMFTDTSSDPDGTIVQWLWDFGDGSGSVAQHPSHTYGVIGSFDVTLRVWDNNGVESQAQWTINPWTQIPVADFDATPMDQRIDDPVVFMDISSDVDGSIVAWFWDFGDGTTSELQHPTHTYSGGIAAAGDYTVLLRVFDNHGASASTSKVISTHIIPPTADFDLPVSGVVGEAIQFTDTSSDSDGQIMAWQWDFSGSLSTQQHPSRVFTDDGTYDVTLTVTDDHGATDTVAHSIIIVNTPPTANFFFTVPAFADSSTQFTDASSDDQDVVAWSWDFGDGGLSNLQNPSHIYDLHGDYSVTLTVTDSDGAIDDESKVITVDDPEPIASFDVSNHRPLLDEPVAFTDTSIDNGFVTNWLWEFGDGATSTLQYPTHNYTGSVNDAGQKTVKLTITDDYGHTASATKPLFVTYKAPVVLFDITPQIAELDENVFFDARASYDSDGTIVSQTWTIDGVSVPGATHTQLFSWPGTYGVSHTATDNHGAKGARNSFVRVVAHGPMADFEGPTQVAVRETALFKDASTDDFGISSWSWNIEGVTYHTEKVEHTFTTGGTHQVSLTVTDTHGQTASKSASIDVVVHPPIADFSFTAAWTGQVTSFTDASSDPDNGIVQWLWSFPDATSTLRDPSYTFGATGDFDVTLQVTDEDGESATITKTVTVRNSAPIADFDASSLDIELGETVTFTELATDEQFITHYAWSFGSQTAEGEVVTFTPVSSGTYTISLTVTDNDGATATATKTLIVANPPPIADFTFNTVVAGSATTFMDQSSDNREVVAWTWLIEGIQRVQQHPSHTFATDGSHQVTLTVMDDQGATDALTLVVTVLNAPPVVGMTHGELLALSPMTFTDASVDDDAFTTTWNFGDGPVQGPHVAYTFPAAGTYQFSQTVTDDDGGSKTVTHTVVVGSPPPVAAFTAAQPVWVGETIALTDMSTDDGTIVSRVWATPGGELTDDGILYPDNGAYQVTLTVTDDVGKTDSTSQWVVVNNRLPVVQFTHGEGVNEAPMSFTDLSTDDGTIVSWSWDFGDSQFSNEQHPSHIYDWPGVHFVKLTVVDDDGGTSTIGNYIEVARHPPGVEVPLREVTVVEGDAAQFTIRLTGKPLAPVTVQLQVDGQLTAQNFLIQDWHDVHTFSITAKQDTIFEGMHKGEATLRLLSDDPGYHGFNVPLTVHIIDDDDPYLWFSDNFVLVKDANLDRVELRLPAPPQSDVTLTFTAPDGVTLHQQTITFTPENWAKTQYVTFTVDDITIFEREPTLEMTLFQTDDPNYNKLLPSILPLRVADERIFVPLHIELADVDVTEEVHAGELIPEALGYLIWVPDGDNWELRYDVPEPFGLQPDWKITYYVNHTREGGHRGPDDSPRDLPGWQEPVAQESEAVPNQVIDEVEPEPIAAGATPFPWWIVAVALTGAGIGMMILFVLTKRQNEQ